MHGRRQAAAAGHVPAAPRRANRDATAERESFENGLAGVLTPTQRAKMMTAMLHDGHGPMMRGRGHGGPGAGD